MTWVHWTLWAVGGLIMVAFFEHIKDEETSQWASVVALLFAGPIGWLGIVAALINLIKKREPDNG